MDEILNAFKEQYKQKPIETPATPPTETPKPIETPIDTIPFNPSEFNEKYGKKYGREVKEEKELNEIFEAPKKITELETKYKTLEDTHGLTKKQLEDLQTEYDSKKENLKFIDLKKYFATDDMFKANQLKLKFPDKDERVISDILKTDLSKANPVDLLIKKAKFDDADIYSEMDNSQIKEVIAADFGNADLNDPTTWDNVTTAKINKAAKQARIEFDALQKVELPVPIDVEKERETLFSKEKQKFEIVKKQWTPIVDKMLSDFKELVIPDETGKELYKYTPEIGDSFKQEMSQFIDYLAYTGQPINENTLMDVLENIKGRYIVKELPKIMKAHALKVATEKDDEWHNKVNNDKPLSDKTKTAGDKNDVWSKMEQMI